MSDDEFWVDGIPLIFRKSKRFTGYVAVFGPEHAVHFNQPCGGKWFARKPFALEPICGHSDLIECVRLAKRHYDALAAERIRHARAAIDAVMKN